MIGGQTMVKNRGSTLRKMRFFQYINTPMCETDIFLSKHAAIALILNSNIHLFAL